MKPFFRALAGLVGIVLCAIAVASFPPSRPVDAATTLSGLVTLPSPTMVMPGPIVSGQALRLGESIANTFDPRASGLVRPNGSFVYTRDGSNAYLRNGSTNTSWVLLSQIAGAVSTSDAILKARAVSLISPIPYAGGATTGVLTCYRDDRLATQQNLYSITSAGTGAQSQVTGAVGGVWNYQSGATAVSNVNAAQTPGVLGVPATVRGYFAARFAVSTAVDAAAVIFVGLQDATTGATNVGVGVCGATSTVNYVLSRDGSMCVGTNTSTGIAIGATEHLFELVFDGASHVTVYADTVAVLTNVTLSAPPANPMNEVIQVRNGATAANRALQVDFTMSCWPET